MFMDIKNMQGSFKKIPLYFPVKKTNEYKKKYQTTIKEVGDGGQFLDNVNIRLPPSKKRQLTNKEQNK